MMFGNMNNLKRSTLFMRSAYQGRNRRLYFVSVVIKKIKQKIKDLSVKPHGSERPKDGIRHLLRPARRYNGDTKNVMGRLTKSMAPLQHLEYERQLEIKEELCQKYEMKLRNVLRHGTKRGALHPELQARLDRGDSAFPIPKITPSPTIDEYRNKDYPVIGPGVDGKPTVGFYMVPGRFPNMDVGCGKLRPIRQKHFEVMTAFTECVRKSGLRALGHMTNLKARELGGHWRTFLTRSNEAGDLLVAASGVQWNNPDLLQRMKEILEEFFVHGAGRQFDVKSLSFQEQPSIKPNTEKFPFETLHGMPFISEQLHGLKFTVSPGSFFQVNTPAAEILYEKVRQLCHLDQDTILLDLCCGTGTIGMVLSQYVRIVVGIEENHQAVKDATKNAELNNVDNIAFIAGKTERKLPYLLNRIVFPGNKPNIVAVVNPPRAGLGVRFIRAIRNCEEIRKIMYISCKPFGPVINNFVGLLQPPHVPDEKITGKPFVITDTTAVDLFPHTKHFELLLLFER